MKSLDEVIDSITKQSGLEIRDQGHPKKDRFWVDRDTYNDALYYLRMYYSDKVQWESDRKHYEDWIEQYKESRNKHQQAVKEMLKNPPLTWEELKEMVGKPVWVETDEEVKRWEIIEGIYQSQEEPHLECFFTKSDFCYSKLTIGEAWNAYRRERENE